MKRCEFRNTSDRGKGVYAKKDFKKGEVVYYGVKDHSLDKNDYRAS